MVRRAVGLRTWSGTAWPVAGARVLASGRAYWPWTENEVMSACNRSTVTPNARRARKASPAKSRVTSCSYNQSSVRPKPSSFRSSTLAVMPRVHGGQATAMLGSKVTVPIRTQALHLYRIGPHHISATKGLDDQVAPTNGVHHTVNACVSQSNIML
jgi:hypothetical protein